MIRKLLLYAAWFQKWFVHRRLRPEVFGGLIHRKKSDPSLSYPINSEILNSQVLTEIQTKYGSYLSSGHTTMAGACVTVLKAYFHESFAFPNPVEVEVVASLLEES